MNDYPDLPEYLRISQDARRASWRGRKLTKPKPGSLKIVRNEDAQTRAFRKMIEKQQAEKKAMKLKLLREQYGNRR